MAALLFELMRFYANAAVLLELQTNYAQLGRRPQSLEAAPPPEFSAWGQDWYALAPRIDYGAYTRRSKEAEALCYFLWSVPYGGGGPVYLCD